MLEEFTPLELHKNIIFNYLSSFSKASLLRYGKVHLENLYTFSYPIYLSNASDFQFNNRLCLQKYEELFIYQNGKEKLLQLENIKHVDFKIETAIDTICFHLFSFKQFHFLISFEKQSSLDKDLFIITPHFPYSEDIEEIEETLHLLLTTLIQCLR